MDLYGVVSDLADYPAYKVNYLDYGYSEILNFNDKDYYKFLIDKIFCNNLSVEMFPNFKTALFFNFLPTLNWSGLLNRNCAFYDECDLVSKPFGDNVTLNMINSMKSFKSYSCGNTNTKILIYKISNIRKNLLEECKYKFTKFYRFKKYNRSFRKQKLNHLNISYKVIDLKDNDFVCNDVKELLERILFKARDTFNKDYYYSDYSYRDKNTKIILTRSFINNKIKTSLFNNFNYNLSPKFFSYMKNVENYLEDNKNIVRYPYIPKKYIKKYSFSEDFYYSI